MMRFIIFGMFLGGFLGFISSSLDIVIWNSMGRPDILIRPGWEEIGIVVMIISGIFVGLLYGLILNATIRPDDLKVNASFIFFITVFVALVIYTVADFFSIKLFNIWPWFCAHVIVFLISLAIASLRSRPIQTTKMSEPKDGSTQTM
jgi:hypothetical protein